MGEYIHREVTAIGGRYALVSGFIWGWKTATNLEGLAISQVEPIRDPAIQAQVRQSVEAREAVQQV